MPASTTQMGTPSLEPSPVTARTAGALPVCEYRDLGRMPYARAFSLQQDFVARRKSGAIPDVLLPDAELARRGIEVHATDRGGDVTYHGPGQIVGYPILDLSFWKRDVGAYMRALEQVMINAVVPLEVRADRVAGCTGCWVGDAKLGAIGVHISRWVTSHGFALNLSPELDHFSYIVPCGIDKPVTSVEQLTGQAPDREEVVGLLIESFGRVFRRRMSAA